MKDRDPNGCQATTARGLPCGVPPRAGRRCCVWHDDSDPGLAEVRQAGRLRGNAVANENRKRRAAATVSEAHLPSELERRLDEMANILALIRTTVALLEKEARDVYDAVAALGEQSPGL